MKRDREQSATAPGWEHFPDTVLEFTAGGGRSIDLRGDLSAADRDYLASLGLGASFAVITACNPAGARLDRQANEALARRFESAAVERGRDFVRCDGVSPDGSHRERGLALGLDEAEAVALAREQRQLALFWFDGDAFWILPALSRAARLRLPLPC